MLSQAELCVGKYNQSTDRLYVIVLIGPSPPTFSASYIALLFNDNNNSYSSSSSSSSYYYYYYYHCMSRYCIYFLSIYRRPLFNCEILIIANCEVSHNSQLLETQ